jgi:hypothetical protein
MDDSVEAQVSEPDKSYSSDIRIGVAVGAVAFLGAQWVLFVKGPGPGDSVLAGVLLEALACAFLGVPLLMWRNRKRHAIGFDGDGLWLLHIGKQRGLVPWDRIASIRESGVWCRMSLRGRGGEKLVDVEYQRTRLQELRRLVMERMSFRHPVLPAAFRTGIMPRVLFSALAVVGGVSGYGFMFIAPKNESGPIITIGEFVLGPFFMLFTALMFAMAVAGSKSVIERDRLRVGGRTYPYSEIDSVSMSFWQLRGQRYPWVWITLRNGKREFAGPRGTDSLTFQRTLQWALDRWRDENNGAHRAPPFTPATGS